jgi:hypothetical protein
MLPTNLTTKAIFANDIQRYTTVKLYEIQAALSFEQYVASPAEQFEQDVLKTPLPSAQQLSGLPLLLSANPSLFPLLPEILPESPTPTTQSQQPITIDSLLNSATTSGSSQIL